jgi:hypothetical protein
VVTDGRGAARAPAFLRRTKNMGKPTTHVLLVTDKSGSMDHLASDVIGGYNGYLQSLQDDEEAGYRVTSVTFSSSYSREDTGYDVLCVSEKPEDAPRLDTTNYRPAGGTALLDAIGRTITDFEAKTKLAEGDRVLLVVQTDGHENSSREYKREGVAKMITDREAGGQWSAIFMGAGPDTWQQAGGMGFSTSMSYAGDAKGVASSYEGLTATSRSYSRGATRSEAAAASGLKVETDD